MLAGLSDEYKPLVMAVENSKETLSIDMVKNVLLQDAKFDQKPENESALHVKKNSIKSGNKKVQCYNCKLVGHYARNCPSRSNNNNSGNGKSNKNFTHSSSTLLASSVKEFEFCAKTEEKEKCINSNNGVFFYVDSGCSSHMVNDCSLLYDKNILNFEKKLNCQLNALET